MDNKENNLMNELAVCLLYMFGPTMQISLNETDVESKKKPFSYCQRPTCLFFAV